MHHRVSTKLWSPDFCFTQIPPNSSQIGFYQIVTRFKRGRHRRERSGDHVAYRLVFAVFYHWWWIKIFKKNKAPLSSQHVLSRYTAVCVYSTGVHQWIRISNFGLLDPEGDPDRHQNLSPWSLGHALPLQEILSKSVYNFFSYPTDRQTDRSENITSFFGGGNKAGITITSSTRPKTYVIITCMYQRREVPAPKQSAPRVRWRRNAGVEMSCSAPWRCRITTH